MKTDKEIKLERKKIINRYLDGNLLRFLRRHQKQASFQAVYSDYLSVWEKQPVRRLIVKQLKEKLIWPKPIVDVVNIMRTLYMYYEFEYDEDGARAAWEIYKVFENDIDKYNYSKYVKLIGLIGFNKIQKISPKKALKEQKARGFIKADNYDDFDRKACHLQSLVNDDYVYPINFYMHTYPKDIHRKRGTINIYVGQHLIGVRGYTNCRIPKHYTNGTS